MTNEFDRSYNRGYAAGYASGKKAVPSLEAIQTRYEYLRKGGKWQMDIAEGLDGDARHSAEESYLRGFEDAMKVLGLLSMVGP